MAFLSSFIAGLLLGVALVMAFAHAENRRAQIRQRQVTSSMVMSNLTLSDLKRMFSKHPFPGWIVFSDYQKLTWLNHKIKTIWPFLNEATSAMLKTLLEPILMQYRPPIVSSLKFKKFTLGTVAPQFVGVQVSDHKDDEIVMNCELQWEGNPSIILAVETNMGVVLPIEVKDVGFCGVFRLAFKPLTEDLPCFGAVTYSLLVKKKLDLELKVLGGDMTSVPGIAGMIEETILTSINDSLLWPMRQVLPILPGDYSDLALKSIGLLEVKLIQAKDLLNKDVIGKSDPFALLFIRPIPSRKKRSRIIDNQLDPIWNEHFQFEVEDLETQKLTVQVFNEGILSAQLLGYAEVPLKDMEAGALKELWLPLVKDSEKKPDTKKRGEVRLELLYSPFNERQKTFLSESLFESNVNANVVNSPETKRISNGKNHPSPEHKPSPVGNKVSKQIISSNDRFVRGVLSVTILRAENLIAADTNGKADPYAVVVLKKSDQKKKTRVISQELNPQWNETLDFLVEDGLHEIIVVEVWDHDMFRKDYLGRCTLTLTKVLLEGECDVEYQLDGVKSGKVFLHLKWLPQPIPLESPTFAK